MSDPKGMGYWFSQQDAESDWLLGHKDISSSKSTWKKSTGLALYYDFNKKDLYITTPKESLCYSELLGQFVSFMDYQGGVLANIGNSFHALTNLRNNNVDTVQLWNMFEGDYNYFYGDHHQTDITFISNAESLLDKIFTNLEMRVDFYLKGELQHYNCFDTIQVWNEYQDTGEQKLLFNSYFNQTPYKTVKQSFSNLEKKYRIWRYEIPRALKNGKAGLDRIRNTWCKIKLNMNIDPTKEMENMEMHDVQVVYYT